MKISLEVIKALREETSASLNDVKSALEEAAGDKPKALLILRKRGAEIAQRRAGRVTGQGRVEAYIHHDGKLGALVEVQCETDFVARTDEFIGFCRDVAMHVAAMNPDALKAEEPANGTSPDAPQSILLTQPFVKDPSTTVGGLLQSLIGKIGENVVIQQFTRFGLGDTSKIVS